MSCFGHVLGRFAWVRPGSRPGLWSVRCPCPAHKHGDRRPSARVWVDEASGWLHFWCARGCTRLEASTALGLSLSEWGPPIDFGRPDWSRKLAVEPRKTCGAIAMLIKGGGNFVPAPEGVHNAVCVDVVDLGELDTQWGKKWKVKWVWEIEALNKDGKRFLVSKRYTASLHEKSALAKDLKDWRGRPFTADELGGFDPEKTIGVPCQLLVAHNDSDGQVFANVKAILKAGDKKLAPSGQYIRVKDRTDQKPATGAGPAAGDGEEIPF